MKRFFSIRRPQANPDLPHIVMDRKLNHQLCYCAYREQAEAVADAMNTREDCLTEQAACVPLTFAHEGDPR